MMDDKEYALLNEVLKDAESSSGLSQWEEEFLSDLRGRVLLYKENTNISDKQWQVIRRIEGKIYQ